MKTHDLIDVLSLDDTQANVQWMQRRVGPAVLLAALLCLLIAETLWSVRSDMQEAVLLAAFWFKLGFAVSLALIAAWALPSAARPVGLHIQRVWYLLLPVVVIWVRAVEVLLEAPAADLPTLVYGQTWQKCSLLIVALALPLLVASLWACKEAAPSKPRLTGFVLGVLSGAIAASIYSLHCVEMSAFFIGIWYALGILVTGLLGLFLGGRVLRW